MARTIQCISKINLSLFTCNVTRQLIFNGCRTIYTDESMGMVDYRRTRESCYAKYRFGIDTYYKKMNSVVSNDKEMVFNDDLKVMLHLVQKKPEEIELLEKVVDKYNKQTNEFNNSSFKFGPVVMRTCHYLNEPVLAKTLFLKPGYYNFFNQLTTFMILLDLLLENGRFTEIIEIYDLIKDRFNGKSTYPKLAANVVGITCLKQNTMESLEYGLKMCKDIVSSGNIPLRRIVAALGALALKQNQPNTALELVEMSRTPKYISIRCIRVMAFADLDRIDDIVNEFQSSLNHDITESTRYYSDIVSKVEDVIKRLNIDDSAAICDLLRKLKERGYIHNMSLTEHITQPIQTTKLKYNQMSEDQELRDGERGATINSARFNHNRESAYFSRQTN